MDQRVYRTGQFTRENAEVTSTLAVPWTVLNNPPRYMPNMTCVKGNTIIGWRWSYHGALYSVCI